MKSLNEKLEKKDLESFVEFAKDHLGIQKLPEINPLDSKETASERKSFGAYYPAQKKIEVNIADRHPMDSLRTLAHELVHHKQNEDGRLTVDSGSDGSDIENEANSMAAVLMRIYGRNNPHLFEADESHLEITVPLLIRAMEWAREECKTDEDLHKFVEKMLKQTEKTKLLDMSKYDKFVNEDEDVHFPEGPLEKRNRLKRDLHSAKQNLLDTLRNSMLNPDHIAREADMMKSHQAVKKAKKQIQRIKDDMWDSGVRENVDYSGLPIFNKKSKEVLDARGNKYENDRAYAAELAKYREKYRSKNDNNPNTAFESVMTTINPQRTTPVPPIDLPDDARSSDRLIKSILSLKNRLGLHERFDHFHGYRDDETLPDDDDPTPTNPGAAASKKRSNDSTIEVHGNTLQRVAEALLAGGLNERVHIAEQPPKRKRTVRKSATANREQTPPPRS